MVGNRSLACLQDTPTALLGAPWRGFKARGRVEG
jgi:hypothetical protein